MKLGTARRRALEACVGATAVALSLSVAVPAAHADGGHTRSHDHAGTFRQTNLVADQPGMAQLTDPSLVNAWGLASSPTSPLWVSDNGADVTTRYRGGTPGTPVTKVSVDVSIPGGAPTGQVFNPTSRFKVRSGTTSAPAMFLFASENGTIAGWSPKVDMTHALVGFSDPNAVYKGIALVRTEDGPRLLATNFHAGAVDVFDGAFHKKHHDDAFRDRSLPAGYAPFNVAVVDGRVLVSYALQDSMRHDDVAGAGHGFVDEYTTEGRLVRRLVTGGALNSPWAMVVAPEHFGELGGDLLVGNFGDGTIHAYDRETGALVGTLRDAQHHTLVIDGLWALRFGNGTFAGRGTLVFSAGPDGESHGLLGTLRPQHEQD
jgi:uncharacterized protein (TIGR03118 family)